MLLRKARLSQLQFYFERSRETVSTAVCLTNVKFHLLKVVLKLLCFSSVALPLSALQVLLPFRFGLITDIFWYKIYVDVTH